jgi:hypothetical protein
VVVHAADPIEELGRIEVGDLEWKRERREQRSAQEVTFQAALEERSPPREREPAEARAVTEEGGVLECVEQDGVSAQRTPTESGEVSFQALDAGRSGPGEEPTPGKQGLGERHCDGAVPRAQAGCLTALGHGVLSGRATARP